MARRPHRRVHHPQTPCKCPEGTKKVSTCSKSTNVCKGRRYGCIGMVQSPVTGRLSPRFVPMVCDAEAGPVQQWRGKRRYRTRRRPGPQAAILT